MSDATPSSPHTKLGDARRQSLIDSAHFLIAERGMEGFRLRDVAARAGIHHATLHYYFPTKEDLIQAVADQLTYDFLHGTPPDLAGASARLTAREQLHRYFVTIAYQFREAPTRLLAIIELFLHALRDSSIRRTLNDNDAWSNQLIAIISEGIEQGEFRADVTLKEVAAMIVTFSMGLPVLASIHPEMVNPAIEQFEGILLQSLAL
jgi:AcrR family transcriptional regulator